ncbi:serine/threonine-protein kinase [Sorangium sp. So ce131]|uniref:serine/threonine-protein kinase n=1 Tax=Sorangium sp. So ce131 TaxID=3133282 RepID=UPI003F632934
METAPTVKDLDGAPASAAFRAVLDRNAVRRAEHPERTADGEGQRRALRRATYVGLWGWPAFFLLDVYMVTWVYPGAPLWHFAALRLVEQALIVVVYRMTLRDDVPLRRIAAARELVFLAAALFISMMALELGGIRSFYMDGLSIIMLVRCVVAPAPWWSALRSLALLALTYPLVIGAAAVFSASTRATLLDVSALAAVAGHYVFVLASAFLGGVSSHLVWSAQQQVYQARKLGRYRLEARIGQGGMGEVWLAWDDTLRRRVALKLLRMQEAPEPGAVRHFKREARAASMLSSPHTIRIFDFGASDDAIYYIAMEYLPGADLGALLAAYGPMPIPRAARFIAQACESLIEAHDAGVIHRDIKPQNLFVTRVGDDHDFVKLLDFGIARVVPRGEPVSGTSTGVIRGTPEYMAPELFCGEQADARSDIYGLGVTLYALLTGGPPFEGGSLAQVIAAQLSQQPAPPSVRRGEPIPAPLEAIVLRCLEKDPRARFQSMREVASAVQALADDGGWTTRDAERFWRDHVAQLARMEAPTR